MTGFAKAGWRIGLIQIAGAAIWSGQSAWASLPGPVCLGLSAWALRPPGPEQGQPQLGTGTFRRELRMGLLVTLANPKSVTFLVSILAVTLPADTALWAKVAILLGGFLMDLPWVTLRQTCCPPLLSTGPVRRFFSRFALWFERGPGPFLAGFGIRLVADLWLMTAPEAACHQFGTPRTIAPAARLQSLWPFTREHLMPDHLTILPSILYFGTPVVLIVTHNPDGSPNITPMSSAWALGSSVVLGLSAAGQGATNLLREGDCTLNFPSADLWPQVERISATTGATPVPPYKASAGFTHAADKFALGGFRPQASTQVRPPRIRDCPLQFEARLLACHKSAGTEGSAPASHLLIEVEVCQTHAHRDIVLPGTNHIDTAHWNPLLYVFRHYFGNATDLGQNFRAEA